MLLPPRHNYYRNDLDSFDAEVDDDGSCASAQQAVTRSQMATRVTPELISHLEHLFDAECEHPFDKPERQ